MNSLKIEIPHTALRSLWRERAITVGQLIDWLFRVDRTHEIVFPSSFAEMSKKHFGIFTKWIYYSKKDDLWFEKLKRDFIGMSRHQVMAINGIQGDQLDVCLAFLGEPYVNHKSLLKRIGILRGPSDRLKTFTINQMSYVDSYAMAYHVDEKREYLDAFFAAAYCLPPLPFSVKLLDFNTFLFRCVSEKTKKAALHNFLGLRANLVKEHPNTFEGGDDNSGLEKFGWRATMNNLAGPKYGSYYRAQRTLIPDAFLEFEMNSIKIKKMEHERKKASRK